MTRPLRTAVAITMALVLPGCGCSARPGAPSEGPKPPGSAPIADAATDASGDAGLAAAEDPLQVKPEIDDPRLAPAKQASAAGNWLAAAQAIDAAVKQYQPSPLVASRWQYLRAGFLAQAQDLAGAAAAFDLAANATDSPLAPYARLAAARSYLALQKHAEAIARADGVVGDLPITWAAKLVRADSLDATGGRAGAAEIWAQYLAAKRRGPRWAEVSTRLAESLLAGSPDAAAAKHALSLARGVVIEAPTCAYAGRARDAESRALGAIPEKDRQGLEAIRAEDRVVQAQALADAGRRKEAVRICDQVLHDLGKAEHTSKTACDAALAKAAMVVRIAKKAAAADAYAAAVERCETTKGQLVSALFQGARQHSLAGRLSDAAKLYGRVESEFHSHSYADDARLRTAKLALMMNDEPRFVELITKMPDDYPQGDMLEDGLFELALLRMGKADWAGALQVLDQSIKLRPIEKPHWVAGRAKYFHARVLGWTGREADARREFGEVVRDYPFSYYTALAYSQLAVRDGTGARQVVAAPDAAPEPGSIVSGLPSELAVPGFVRAAELLRVGEVSLARDELSLLGLSWDKTPSAMWAVTLVYARAGATDQAYRVVRGRTQEWSVHYPVGKWRAAWELAFPRPYFPIVDKETRRSHIPAALGYGIMREESSFEADVVSHANAYGLMQLVMGTATEVGKSLGMTINGPEMVKRPEVNIALGCKLLGDLRSSFPGAPVLAIPSYNAGMGATRKWLPSQQAVDFDLWVERIPYDETRLYTKRVIASTATYGYLYERDGLDEWMKLPVQLKP